MNKYLFDKIYKLCGVVQSGNSTKHMDGDMGVIDYWSQ
jgi:hypothetical protein